MMIVTLPALPWVSCPRVLLDNNPRLHHLPHLVGCQVQGDNGQYNELIRI